MKRDLADLTPALFDLAFDADKIAFAQVFKDLGAKARFARNAQDPRHAWPLIITGENRRDRERQFAGAVVSTQPIWPATAKQSMERRPASSRRRRAASRPRDANPAHAGRGLAQGARASAPEGLALRAPDRVRQIASRAEGSHDF